MSKLIQSELALVPLAVLNAVLVNHGIPARNTTAYGIIDVTDLITTGKVTLDEVKTTKPSAVSRASVAGGSNDLMVEAHAQVTKAVADVEAIRQVADSALDNALAQATKLERKFDELSARLNAKVDAVETPSDAVIASVVSAQFDAFRKVTPKAKLVEIAQALPTTTRKLAKEVFDGDLSYIKDGVTVDFSGIEVSVWNDPSAPALVSDYVFAPAHLHQALLALDDVLPDNVWLAGERGTGKTEFVNQLASRLGRKLFRINFDEALERADFIGANTIENGNVVWKAGVLSQAIQYAGAIVLFDEIGFARAQNIAILHSVCEPSPHRSIVIPETGVRIAVAPHVVFFGADNSNGFGDSSGNFAGVRDQNTAFLDRFSFTLRFEYLPQDQEVDLVSKRTGLSVASSEIIVKFANVAREKARAGLLTQPPSLRQLFAFARAVRKGLPVSVAFENAIVNKFPQDCEAELRGVFSATVDVANFKEVVC